MRESAACDSENLQTHLGLEKFGGRITGDATDWKVLTTLKKQPIHKAAGTAENRSGVTSVIGIDAAASLEDAYGFTSTFALYPERCSKPPVQQRGE
jgi:hypothetical protein